MLKRLKIVLMCTVNIISAVEFSVLTQNILGPNTQDVTSLGFKKGDYSRLNGVVVAAINKNPTFLCFQEWDSKVYSNLETSTKGLLKKDYTVVSSQPKGANGGVILYVRQHPQINILEKGGLGLENGSLYKGAAAYGIFDIQGKKVLVASLHLSRANFRTGLTSGDMQWTDLHQKLDALIKKHNCAVIFVGDFNTFYEEVLNYTLQKVGSFFGVPISMYEHESLTVNDGSGDFASIDHVLYSPVLLALDTTKSWVGSPTNPYRDQQVKTATKKFKASNQLITQQYPFDHATIFATFTFGVGASGQKPTGPNSSNSKGSASSNSTDVRKTLEQSLELATLLKKN